MKLNQHSENLLKAIQELSCRHSPRDIFSDFVELSALAVSNSVDKTNRNKREEQYLKTICKYTPNEQQRFKEMFAELVEALQYEVTQSEHLTDILGALFHDLELHSQWNGQYFTPQYVCDLMGEISFSEPKDDFIKKECITVYEPACGSGAMILGFANAMKKHGLNYCTQAIITATDIDLKCVHMCYLQLSLYGIPAVVIHGNTITLEEWSRWYTPIYVTRKRIN